ncbi:uncharacterized protein LOC113591019 isoform X2 [Electrophorus electricus]|uniref:uncharacterized protein LOC113591019 isoform X2 n=1 Tax=Electrophorus electricus TaxID=8005 RepID=UPI0015D020A4|nr:uncharacterized protein LOC113591019 isoform X2 [Electrophorus electricus]
MTTKRFVYIHVLVALVCLCVVTSQVPDSTESPSSPTSSASSNSIVTATVPALSAHSSDTTKEPREYNETATASTGPDNSTVGTGSEITESTSAPDKITHSIVIVSTTEVTKSTTAAPGATTKDAVAAVCLVFILIFIIILAIILYILWKKGRSYSFDLSYHANEHDTPLRSMEHGGTFEQTSKELTAALDYGQEDKPRESSPVANGCAGEPDPACGETEQTASSEHHNVPEEDSFFSDTSLTPPIKKVEFDLDLDLMDRGSEQATSATDEASELQQNENNNNITNTGNDMDVFTEISLDEPQ